MRSTRAWFWVCVLGTLLLAQACDDDDGGDAPVDAGGLPEGDAGSDGGMALQGSVQGLLKDTSGQGIGNVTVSVGGQKVTTEKDGTFDVASVPEGDVQVAVEDKKLSAAQAQVTVKGEEKATVALTADNSVVVAIPAVEKGGVIEKDGVTVVLPMNSLHKENGSVAKGAGEMHFVVVADPGQAKAAPGGMKSTMGDQPVQLAASGIIDVRFYQGDERLRFIGEADLTFPLGPNNKNHGDQVDVYSFDETTGKWVPDGKGTVQRVEPSQPGSVTTKAKHFSWWAAAEPLGASSCVSGQLASTGTPVAGGQVELTSPDSLLYVQASSAADGSFCLPTPIGATVAVNALGSGASSLLTWSWEATAGIAPASCGGACSELPAQEPTPYDPVELDASVPEDGGVEPDAQVPVDGGDDMDANVEPDGSVETDGSVVTEDGSVQLPDGSTVVAEICNNGLDDDQDEFYDCNDPDCTPASPGCIGLNFHGDGASAGTATFGKGSLSSGTIELWFLAENFGGKGGSVLVDMASCGDNMLRLEMDGELRSVFTDCSFKYTSETSWTGPVEPLRWYHVARTWTPTEHHLYVDGVLVDQTTHQEGAVSTGGTDMELAQQYDGKFADYFFRGNIDEVRLWDQAHSGAAIAARRYDTVEGETAGLVGGWPLNEGGTSSSAADVSGNNNPIYLEGGAEWFPTPPDIPTK